jgi:hypothetical protein
MRISQTEPLPPRPWALRKRSRNVPTSGDKPYHSVTSPKRKSPEIQAFSHSVSVLDFSLLASMQPFESARRLQLPFKIPQDQQKCHFAANVCSPSRPLLAPEQAIKLSFGV